MIRIRWSEMDIFKPIEVIADPLNYKSLYVYNNYLLFKAYIDFGTYKRELELSIPVKVFKRAIQHMPINIQQLFKTSKVKFTVKKIERGNAVITNVIKYV